MTIEKRQIKILFVKLVVFSLIDILLEYFSCKSADLIRTFTVFILFVYFVGFVFLVSETKELVSFASIIWILCFFFWAGIPVARLTGISFSHSNWGYTKGISTEIICEALKYIIYCSEALCLGFSFTTCNKSSRIRARKLPTLQNEAFIEWLSFKAFLVLFPLAFLWVFQAGLKVMKLSYLVATENYLQSGFRLQYEKFVLYLGILSLVYSKSEKRKKIVLCILFIYGCLFCTHGTRTNGIGILVSLFMYVALTSKKSLKKFLVYFLCGIFLILIIGGIAFIRVKGVNFSNINEALLYLKMENPLLNVLGELGISFIPLLYTISYWKNGQFFLYGKSYIIAFLGLIPNSFIPFVGEEIRNVINQYSCAIWVSNNSPYSYLGENFLAEVYMNWGFVGGLGFMLVMGMILRKFCKMNFRELTLWQKYIYISYSSAVLTIPRREFIWLINPIFYICFAMYIFLSLCFFLLKSRFQE